MYYFGITECIIISSEIFVFSDRVPIAAVIMRFSIFSRGKIKNFQIKY